MEALLSTLTRGGPIVGVLIVISLFSLTLIVMKLLQFRGTLSGDRQREAAYALWSRGDRVGAMKAVEGGGSPVDRMLLAAMSGLRAGHQGGALDTELEWRGNSEVEVLSRHIRTLELIAMISPLLGLLGTVLGMIHAFQELALAEGAANASLLAAGIWQALLTTAAGLVVAIPAAIAASLFASRVDRITTAMERAVGRLIAVDRQRH
ncbi:MotA/TolQ/ExbB proton channel family protein [Tropicimonas sp.]|uniref:MotA/TolQ/ExbB proton channel family protein n=1 Tax=Tropicimonas sp. TaxID=2067044 RepID=UPI003A8528B0